MTKADDIIRNMYDKPRPLVFGHRGAMAYAPMNTLAAYELAAEQGADGIELDVWLSQDDVPVIIHDFEVNETTDGEGRVGSMPLEALKELDAGSWFSDEYAGERIPTLDEVFETVGQKLYINVEIKSVDLKVDDVAEKTIACIQRHNMQERVIVSCFNPFVLRRVNKIAPEIPMGFLQADEMPFYIKWMMFGVPYEADHPHIEQMTAERVEKSSKRGRVTNVWTVNEPEDAKRLRDFGVNGMITDNPDVILNALSE